MSWTRSNLVALHSRFALLICDKTISGDFSLNPTPETRSDALINFSGRPANGCIEKLSGELIHRQVQVFAKAITRMDGMPAAELKGNKYGARRLSALEKFGVPVPYGTLRMGRISARTQAEFRPDNWPGDSQGVSYALPEFCCGS
jgi:hypothetical protein